MVREKEAAAVGGSCSKSGWILLAVRVAVQLLLGALCCNKNWNERFYDGCGWGERMVLWRAV